MENRKPDYRNWVPKMLVVSMATATVVSIAALIAFGVCGLWTTKTWRIILSILLAFAAVGCGSGALTIACAKRNPQGRMAGVDCWGKDYAEFSLPRCQKNAEAEGVGNTEFQKGDAAKLAFADEAFDAVTNNYVYHNISGVDKQALLLETLRTLKKDGTFAIHDLMGKNRYGDMEAFCQKLRDGLCGGADDRHHERNVSIQKGSKTPDAARANAAGG